MRLDLDDYIEIPRWSSREAAFSLAPQLEARSGVHARRDLHAERVKFSYSTYAATGTAGIGDDAPLAMTLAATPGDIEETLLEADLPLAPAGGTGARWRTGLGTAAVTSFAGSMPGNLDLFFDAKSRFFKSDV